MTTPTAARPTQQTASHYYKPDGTPAYEVPKADGKGMRKTNIADCRKLGLLPSVTTILSILEKPALTLWKSEQAALSVLTTPRNEGEELDAFVYRVLHEERQQDQEAQIARDKGSLIHSAFEAYFSGQPVDAEIDPWVRPAIDALIAYGELASSEVVLVGNGYAGRTDLVQNCGDFWRLWDFKSSKRLPDPGKGGAYAEHKLQLSAYARAWSDKLKMAGGEQKPILTGNLYVSTVTQGEFTICEHEEDWEETFEKGFRPLVEHWAWSNRYSPPGFIPKPPPIIVPVAPVVTAAAPVPTPSTAGAAPTNTNLPTHGKDGRKIVWSTGITTPPTAQKLPGAP